MSTKNDCGYVLLYRGAEWHKQLSLEEIQRVVNELRAWIELLTAQGKVKGGMVLAREGATIYGKEKRVVSDGPFAESKEAIGGTLLLDVETMEEAIAIARTSPSLNYGATIDVRPVGRECPLNAHARKLGREAGLAEA
jgi:hypothetical protein